MFISYNQAIKLDPRDAKLCYNKGNLLADLGQYEEALNV